MTSETATIRLQAAGSCSLQQVFKASRLAMIQSWIGPALEDMVTRAGKRPSCCAWSLQRVQRPPCRMMTGNSGGQVRLGITVIGARRVAKSRTRSSKTGHLSPSIHCTRSGALTLRSICIATNRSLVGRPGGAPLSVGTGNTPMEPDDPVHQRQPKSGVFPCHFRPALLSAPTRANSCSDDWDD